MWINHIAREENLRDQRRLKVEKNQHLAFQNVEKDNRKDKIREKFVTDGMGNSIINEMKGDPIQKVAKLRQKKRDKLKKYLYQGKNKGDYESSKYKLQKGNGVSIILTPDYSFKTVMEPEKAAHHDEILKQINRNAVQKDFTKKLEKEDERKIQN
mmetsp:Transcript_15022/g.13181  ORF Transcript_15022/g.13181 Transcript_15022/m.13181 type:complete len:155 (+) Transcript_15022:167-631(+)